VQTEKKTMDGGCSLAKRRRSINDDPKNVRINVGYMLDRDPSLSQPLKEGVGAVFERKNKDESWIKVTDWTPPE
jgi:hypothetical protein